MSSRVIVCPTCRRKKLADAPCIKCGQLLRIKDETLQKIREMMNQSEYLRKRGLNAKWNRFARKSRITPAVRARVLQRFFEYLSRARIRGKDISTKQKRQPYLLAAMRWEQATPESRVRDRVKKLVTGRRKKWYYDAMTARAKQRLKGGAGW